MNWDNNLVSAIANIISAVIGAAGTIVAALISKTYIGRKIKNPEDILKPNSITSSLLKLFRFFRVPEAVTFDAQMDTGYIHTDTGITIALKDIDSFYKYVSFEYQFPSQDEPENATEVQVGWRKIFKYRDHLYAITLIYISYQSSPPFATFDFRSTVNEVQPM